MRSRDDICGVFKGIRVILFLGFGERKIRSSEQYNVDGGRIGKASVWKIYSGVIMFLLGVIGWE